MYSWAISGAQRLPNGNTLICDGIHGNLLEVTSSGQVIWKYINPVINTGPLYQGDSIPQDPTHPGEYRNMVFRAQRYSPTHPGLLGRDLTPGNFLELYPTGVEDGANQQPSTFELYQNYPNPFNPITTISWKSPVGSWQTLKIYDVLGNEVATLVNEYKPAGSYEVEFSARGGQAVDSHQLASGVYFYQLRSNDFTETKKLMLLK
jgi:hypothetical protein